MNLNIDPLNLFEECRRNPKLMADCSTDLAKATKQASILYRRSKFLRGAIAKGCRMDGPTKEEYLADLRVKYNWIGPYLATEMDMTVPKITDSAVNDAVASHPGVFQLEMELIDAQQDENILKGQINAIFDRRDELKQLVTLVIRNMGADAEVNEETVRDLTTMKIHEELNDGAETLRRLSKEE